MCDSCAELGPIQSVTMPNLPDIDSVISVNGRVFIDFDSLINRYSERMLLAAQNADTDEKKLVTLGAVSLLEAMGDSLNSFEEQIALEEALNLPTAGE